MDTLVPGFPAPMVGGCAGAGVGLVSALVLLHEVFRVGEDALIHHQSVLGVGSLGGAARRDCSHQAVYGAPNCGEEAGYEAP